MRAGLVRELTSREADDWTRATSAGGSPGARALIRPQQQIEGRQVLVAGSGPGGLRCFRDCGCEVGERADIEAHVARSVGSSVTRNGLEQANRPARVRPHTASTT
jgi:hypothetical protein